MYGIVNKAIEELVVSLRGMDGWQHVCKHAGLENFTFVNVESYADDITHRLVASASEALGNSPEEVLRAFGHHWIRYTGQQGYGAMFQMLGKDVMTFLERLPELHDHIALVFPDILMPMFQTSRQDERTMHVAYRSTRRGMAPFVFGLLEGTGELFGQTVEVRQLASFGPDCDHDLFEVTLAGA